MSEQYYDLVGDLHGHAGKLVEILEAMDYALVDGCYRHPTRKLIFLGDFVDRGPQQRQLLQIVMAMVQQGAALSVMGNHEFNALGYHTENPNKPGAWLRPRTNKNTFQHIAFLNEYLGTELERELDDALAFFRSLPLWIELDGLRVVHACWESSMIKALQPHVDSNNCLTDALLIEASTKDTPAYEAIEILLKGVEHSLPDNGHFFDKDGVKRHEVRTQWWHNHDCTMGDVAFPPGVLNEEQANKPISAGELVGYSAGERPVFLGHYWLKGHPTKLADNVACLDYSVAKGGKLVAYRWNGEAQLSDASFIVV